MRLVPILILALLPSLASAAAAGLELRRIDKGILAAEGKPLAPEHVRSFPYAKGRSAIILNPSISAITPVGNELWVGYTNQAFGVIGQQGITRINQLTGKHTRLSPEDLKTHSPIRAICRRPGSDEVWVLFAQRLWLGAEKETIADPKERALNLAGGIGVWKNGQWQFPVQSDGVPDHFEEEYWDESHQFIRFKRPLPLTHMAVAGDKLYVANRIGVYEGPGTFKPLFPEHARVMGISPSADGKSLLMICTRDFYRTHGSPIERLRHDPATGKQATEPMKNSEYAWSLLVQPTLEDPEGDWEPIWARIPGTDLAVGPLPEGEHRAVRTEHAAWVQSFGRLLRIDAKALAE